MRVRTLARPLDRVLALLDILLGGAALVVGDYDLVSGPR